MRPAAIYVWRTRKPGAILGLPIIGRHFAYVGQSRNLAMRKREHLYGGGRYRQEAARWSDLEPKMYVLLKLPFCPQWLLNVLEVMFIQLLWPVYNDRFNRQNLRRISRRRSRNARTRREVTGQRWAPVPTVGTLIMYLILIAAGLGVWAR
jgi:hypothetical protein